MSNQSPAGDSPADPPIPKATEQQLRRAFQELSFHMDNTPLAVLEWDHEFRLTRWAGQAEHVFGWTAAEVLGKRPHEWPIVHPDDAPRVDRVIQEMIARRNPRNVVVNRNLTRAGAVIWCEWHNSVMLDDDGRVVSILSLALDITERTAAAEALALNEARLRAALASAKMLGWEWDIAASRASFSGDFAAFYGLPPGPDYTRPENLWQAIHPDDIGMIREAGRRAAEAREEIRFEHRGRIPAEAGRPRWFAARGQILRGPDGIPTRVVGVSTDITDQKRAEEQREALDRQLLDGQKWESLGVLAGGVAHDFNNILTVVLGSAGLARKSLPRGSSVHPHLDQIETASRRAADLCRQMLAYAGRGIAPAEPTDLNQLIRESAALLEVPASRRTRLRFDLADDLPPVQADAPQVRQVLMNLMMNAAEALGDTEGEVIIRTTPAAVTPDPERYHLPPGRGRHVALAVTDTGSGMTAEVKARVFDPFFSTKFAGRGLGLAAVLGIVRSHRGAIRVDSEPGRGTTVEVLWPVAGESDEVGPAPASITPAAEASGLALVVDDEMFVREVAASTLEDMGYQPLLAGDGPAAVALCGKNRGAVRVAVIDMVMPGMPGDRVVELLRQEEPGLPVVLVSGLADRRAIQMTTAPRTEFLQKPFHPDQLAAAVRRVVGVKNT